MIIRYLNLENTANDPLSVNPNLKGEDNFANLFLYTFCAISGPFLIISVIERFSILCEEINTEIPLTMIRFTHGTHHTSLQIYPSRFNQAFGECFFFFYS